jgi:hypothetical protein
MSRSGEQGNGRLSFLVTVAIVGIVAFVAVKIVPVRIDAYSFRDTLREEARLGAVRKSNEAVFERIMSRAMDLGIPLERKNLRVHRTDRKFVIQATYEQPVDLAVTTYHYRFYAREEAPLF